MPGSGPSGVPASQDSWPLALVLDEVLGRAGLRLVAIDDRDPEDSTAADHGPGRPADGDPSAMAGQPQAGQVARAPRVLVVDDNPAMRRVLRGLLEDAGMQVVAEAADGLEGVTQSDAVQPDVVLVDWRMPHLDGIQATARIRQRLPQVQVVMFSSAVGPDQATWLGRSGPAPSWPRALHPSSSVPPCWPPGSSHPHKPQVTVSA
jgi:two-component system, chemotaxis family, chemotaxis protein CheY